MLTVRTYKWPIFIAVIIIGAAVIATIYTGQFENILVGIISTGIVEIVVLVYDYQRSLNKYLEINQKDSKKITPEEFNIDKYHPYYYGRNEDDKISNAIEKGKNLIIIGKPKSGKTRAAYEAIKRQVGFKVIKFASCVKIEEIPNNIFSGKKIIFIDDLNEYVGGKLDVKRLKKLLDSKAKIYSIIATCRTGEEYEKLYMDRAFSEVIGGFEEVRMGDITIKDINEDIALSSFNRVNLKFEDFDGTIGSLFLGLGQMKRRYEGLIEECHILFRIIKLLANANSYEIHKKTLAEVYKEQRNFEGISSEYSFESVLKLLKDGSFILQNRNQIKILNNVYFDFSDYKPTFEDFIWLKNTLININNEKELYNLGFFFIKNKSFQEAIECYDKVLKITPNDVAILNKGMALAELQKSQEAIEMYDILIAENSPKIYFAFFNKGSALHDLEKYEASIKYFTKALKIDPNSELALHSRGNSYYKLGRYEDAIKDFEAALTINPEIDVVLYKISGGDPYYSTYYSRGNSYYKLGRYEDAIKDFEAALTINPKNIPASNNRSYVLQLLEQKPKLE